MPHKTYNTPKRKCVVKTRLTEDERRAFEDKCAALSMSQSEYIRHAVFYSRISPVIRVTAHSEEMLTAISSLYLTLSAIPPAFFKGHTERKIPENDTEIIHQTPPIRLHR